MRSEEVKVIFDGARALEVSSQEEYVRGRCAGDRSLAEQVIVLLNDLRDAGDFLLTPVRARRDGEGGSVAATCEGPGSEVGRYRLRRLIGEGGFGSVFEAEQREPVRRTVALKLIKTGMDTRRVIARFEQERQALALMDHPHIAKVLDAGATDTGRPYFVMELVRGEPITTYCDAHRLSIKGRLDVFLQVCLAVQHAHQKGVIHRDIKPSNILATTVDDAPVPKVIDFGIAKATGARLTEKTIFTEHRMMIGTPEYMSPEQAEMGQADVDTRTDIYSLGVLLYELLTSVTPFDPERLRSASWLELQRIIRQVEPPKPSTRLSAMKPILANIAQQRQTEPGRLRAILHGDLDTIVTKAMAKDPARRYATAAELAADIRRHLSDEPIVARPASALYQLRKFAKRNKALVGGFAGVVVALILGIVGTTTFALRAARREHETRLVSEFQAKMIYGIDAWRMGERLLGDIVDQSAEAWRQLEHPSDEARIAERSARLKEDLEGVSVTTLALRSLHVNLFKGTLEEIEKQFGDRPALKATMLHNTAVTMLDLGLLERARDPLQEALDIRRSVLGDEHRDTLDSLFAMARLNSRTRPAEAEAQVRAVLKAQTRVLGPEHHQTLTSVLRLGVVLAYRNRYAEAEPYLKMAVELREKVLSEDHPDTLDAMIRLGQLYVWWGKLGNAEEVLRDVAARVRRSHPDDDSLVASVLSPLANMRLRQGRFEEARRLWATSSETLRLARGQDDGSTLFSEEMLGWTLLLQGDLTGAERQLMRVLRCRQRNQGTDGRDTLEGLSVVWEIGVLRQLQRNLVDAEAQFKAALAGYRDVLGPHPDATTLHVVERLSDVLDQTGRSSEAESLRVQFVGECLEDFRASHAMASTHLAPTLQFRESLGYPLAAPSKLVQVGINGEFAGEVAPVSSRFYVLLRRIRDGGALQRQFLDLCRANYGRDDEGTLSAMATMAWHLAQEGRLTDAATLATDSVEGFRRTMPTPNRNMLDAMDTLAGIVRQTKGPEYALPLYEEIHREYLKHSKILGLPDTGTCIRRAQCMAALNRLSSAENVLLECHDAVPEPKARDLRLSAPLAQALIGLYEAWHAADPAHGYDVTAANWRSTLERARAGAISVTEEQLFDN